MTTFASGSLDAALSLSPFEQLCGHTRETSLLASIEALLGWDERTQLPPAAGEYRAEQMATSKWGLRRIAHVLAFPLRVRGILR